MYYTHTIRPLKGVVPAFYLKPMEVRQSSAGSPAGGPGLSQVGLTLGGGRSPRALLGQVLPLPPITFARIFPNPCTTRRPPLPRSS